MTQVQNELVTIYMHKFNYFLICLDQVSSVQGRLKILGVLFAHSLSCFSCLLCCVLSEEVVDLISYRANPFCACGSFLISGFVCLSVCIHLSSLLWFVLLSFVHSTALFSRSRFECYN